MAFTVDVAQTAGVSPSTVSLVVNGKGRVSPATRQRVRQAIARLGYGPRRPPAAPGKATQRQYEVAVVYCRDTVHNGAVSKLTGQIIEGIRHRLNRDGGHMSLYPGQAHVRADVFLRQRLEAGTIDGLILLGPKQRDGYLDMLSRQGLPLVVVNRHASFNEFSSVSVDYHGGGRLGVEHLLSLGHQRIAMVIGSRRQWPTRPIVAGMLEALRKRKLAPALMQVIDPRNPPANLAQRVVDSGATAVFSGDHACAGLLEAFERMGVNVPGRMSVLGFDDLGVVSARGLKLTTIGYDKQRIGRLATAMALRLSRRTTHVRHASIAIAVRLVNGQTTAPPPPEVSPDAESGNVHHQTIRSPDEAEG